MTLSSRFTGQVQNVGHLSLAGLPQPILACFHGVRLRQPASFQPILAESRENGSQPSQVQPSAAF